MRSLLAALRVLFAVTALALAVVPLAADDYTDNAALDALFAQLKDAPDPATADQIDKRVWSLWLTPEDPELARRMTEVLAVRQSMSLEASIRLLDQMVADYPTYAEGWNQRATLYYMTGDLDASLADCAKVLEFEPRHFGALSGRALIYLQQGKRALALIDIKAALEVHPFLNERMLFPELAQPDVTRI